MARKYTPGALGAWYRSKMRQLEDGLEDAMTEAGEEGASLMKQMIETRGTGRRWAYPRNGREGSFPGRDDTGKMKNAVRFRIASQGGSRQLRIGWVSGTREDYFWLQDQGFTQYHTGIEIEGMNALQDATEAAFESLFRRIGEKIR